MGGCLHRLCIKNGALRDKSLSLLLRGQLGKLSSCKNILCTFHPNVYHRNSKLVSSFNKTVQFMNRSVGTSYRISVLIRWCHKKLIILPNLPSINTDFLYMHMHTNPKLSEDSVALPYQALNRTILLSILLAAN